MFRVYNIREKNATIFVKKFNIFVTNQRPIVNNMLIIGTAIPLYAVKSGIS